MNKFITVSEFRELHSQLHREEISYSRMVELINEMAAKYYLERDIDINQTVAGIVDHLTGPSSGCVHPVYSDWSREDVIRVISKNFVISKNTTPNH